MIIAILIISIVFLWLMIETKGLTIQLPLYEEIPHTLEGLIDITPLLIYAVFVAWEITCAFAPEDKKTLKFLERLINNLWVAFCHRTMRLEV